MLPFRPPLCLPSLLCLTLFTTSRVHELTFTLPYKLTAVAQTSPKWPNLIERLTSNQLRTANSLLLGHVVLRPSSTYLVWSGNNQLLAGRMQVHITQDGICIQLNFFEFSAVGCIVEKDL